MPSEKELKLLTHLRLNSREKLTEISKETHIPISTLFDMLNELQGTAIFRNTVLLNFSHLGYHTRAQIFLKVPSDKKDELRKHLSCHNNVNTVCKINNGWDFIAETVHKNIKELNEFLDILTQKFKVEQKEIHYLIEDVKREGFGMG